MRLMRSLFTWLKRTFWSRQTSFDGMRPYSLSDLISAPSATDVHAIVRHARMSRTHKPISRLRVITPASESAGLESILDQSFTLTDARNIIKTWKRTSSEPSPTTDSPETSANKTV